VSDGWYVSRAGHVFGPYSWERVLELAREGSIGADDLVIRPGSDEWARADTVPAFAGHASAAPTAAVEPAAPPARAAPPTVVETSSAIAAVPAISAVPVPPGEAATASEPRTPELAPPVRDGKRALLKIAVGLAVALVVGVVAWLLMYLFLPTERFIPPSPGNVIETKAYGSVQSNRIVISLDVDGTREDADRLAKQLDGSLVGEWEDDGLYTIEFPNKKEAGLAAALKTASGAKGVQDALPDRVSGPSLMVGVGGPGDGVTDIRGTWFSTTPGKGLVFDVVNDATYTGRPLRIESDVEWVIDGVDGGRATGKGRSVNIRNLLGGQSTAPVPDEAFHNIVLDIGKDGALSNESSKSSPLRSRGTVEGDRIRMTLELKTPSGSILNMKGTMDLTRNKVIRPGERLQLSAYVMYGNGYRPQGKQPEAEKIEAEKIEWSVDEPNGKLDRQHGFTATEPGNYTVRVRYKAFTHSMKVRVKSKFAGRYSGTLEIKKGTLAPIEFTVDDSGAVTGEYHYVMDVSQHTGKANYEAEARTSCEFKGSVLSNGELQASGLAQVTGSNRWGKIDLPSSISPTSHIHATFFDLGQSRAIPTFEGAVDDVPTVVGKGEAATLSTRFRAIRTAE